MASIAPLLLVALLSLAVQLAPSAACPSYSCPKPKPPPPPRKLKPPPSSVPCPPPPHSPKPTPPHTPTPKPPVTPPVTPPSPSPVPPAPVPATPPPSSPPKGKCPIDTLKLLGCVDALNGLVHALIGSSASDTCCPLLSGVADLDAALCLCTTIKLKALNISLVLPIAIEVLVNECGKTVPEDFQCPS